MEICIGVPVCMHTCVGLLIDLLTLHILLVPGSGNEARADTQWHIESGLH